MATNLKIALFHGSSIGFDTDWRISCADSSYALYSNKGFTGIPENGDPFGIIAKIVLRARVENSGITMIRVEDHRVTVSYSLACTTRQIHDLLLAGIRTSGQPHEIVRDFMPAGVC